MNGEQGSEIQLKIIFDVVNMNGKPGKWSSLFRAVSVIMQENYRRVPKARKSIKILMDNK